MIEQNISLAQYTTFKVGGLARFFARVRTRDDLAQALAFQGRQKVPLLVIGGGSNVVIGQAGFAGLVIRIEAADVSWDEEMLELEVGPAMTMADLVNQTVARGWAGLAWAGGLPGTIGGAVRGNAGAFGSEIKDSVLRVETIDLKTGREQLWPAAACQFRYRSSVFKTEADQLIWRIRLGFQVGDPSQLAQIRNENITYRQTHHPQAPSAGSIFQNLTIRDLPNDFFDRFPELKLKIRGEKLGAGSLLDLLRFRGRRVGDAMVSQEHANIIVNTGSATGEDVQTLAQAMKEAVKSHFAIELHEEPEFIIKERTKD